MTNEKRQEFTLRITQANQSQLVVVLYEIFFCYLEEATEANQSKDYDTFGKSLQKAQDCVCELIGSLHMEQPLAQSLFQIYLFVSHQIGLANGKRSIEPLTDVERLMKKLYESYKEDSKLDTSGPVMAKAQTVYAGLTYGKNTLSESCQDPEQNRGFWA